MYLKLIAHGIAFMSVRSTIFYIVLFDYSFLGHGKLNQFGGSGNLTSANLDSMCAKQHTITVIELYCCGLISHKLPARGTATDLLRPLQCALLEITYRIPYSGSPKQGNTRKIPLLVNNTRLPTKPSFST